MLEVRLLLQGQDSVNHAIVAHTGSLNVPPSDPEQAKAAGKKLKKKKKAKKVDQSTGA